MVDQAPQNHPAPPAPPPAPKYSYQLRPGRKLTIAGETFVGPATVQVTAAQAKSFADALEPAAPLPGVVDQEPQSSGGVIPVVDKPPRRGANAAATATVGPGPAEAPGPIKRSVSE